MKTIYTFTLESDEYHSQEFRNNLRLFAHLLYHSVYNYDVRGSIPLNINNNITYNEIHDESFGTGYYFDSDRNLDGFINYEPFLIGEHSFGLTVVDDSVNEQILNVFVREILYMLKLNYKVTIKSVCYPSKDKNDESRRRKAMRIVYSNLGCEVPPRKFGFSRKRTINNERCVTVMRVLGK